MPRHGLLVRLRASKYLNSSVASRNATTMVYNWVACHQLPLALPLLILRATERRWLVSTQSFSLFPRLDTTPNAAVLQRLHEHLLCLTPDLGLLLSCSVRPLQRVMRYTAISLILATAATVTPSLAYVIPAARSYTSMLTSPHSAYLPTLAQRPTSTCTPAPSTTSSSLAVSARCSSATRTTNPPSRTRSPPARHTGRGHPAGPLPCNCVSLEGSLRAAIRSWPGVARSARPSPSRRAPRRAPSTTGRMCGSIGSGRTWTSLTEQVTYVDCWAYHDEARRRVWDEVVPICLSTQTERAVTLLLEQTSVYYSSCCKWCASRSTLLCGVAIRRWSLLRGCARSCNWSLTDIVSLP